MIIHLPHGYSHPRLPRRGVRDASDLEPYKSRHQDTFIVDNCGYHPKRGKLDHVREVPDDIAQEILDVQHQRALLHARFSELLREAYAKGKPYRPYAIKESD